jgi:hypothetical protein
VTASHCLDVWLLVRYRSFPQQRLVGENVCRQFPPSCRHIFCSEIGYRLEQEVSERASEE